MIIEVLYIVLLAIFLTALFIFVCATLVMGTMLMIEYTLEIIQRMKKKNEK